MDKQLVSSVENLVIMLEIIRRMGNKISLINCVI